MVRMANPVHILSLHLAWLTYMHATSALRACTRSDHTHFHAVPAASGWEIMLTLLCIVALSGGASASAPKGKLGSTEVVPFDKSHIARQLTSTTVSSAAGLTSALADTAIDVIELADGTYPIMATLNIARDVTIRAATSGGATLDGQNQRQIIYISLGIVVLVGLHITRGAASGVSAC